MLICSMHPTVLHENSTLISGDFPGLARQYLQQHVTHPNCPVLYHTGPAGNQSSRHAVRGNTFDEARRLGELVGKAAQQAIQKMQFVDDLRIRCSQVFVDLPLRTMEPLPQAEKKAAAALTRLRDLQASDAPKATVRTAECDWFGAAEAVTLSRAASNGELQHFARSCLPAEVQLIRIGEWNFIAWPGEIFVEFGLELKRRVPNTHIITYANGDLQGYLVTGEAVDEGGYEASNAIFKSPESGNRLVEASLQLLR
jgi:hypothetical protein